MSCVFDSVFKSNGETTNAQQSQTIRKLLKIKSLALSKHPLASWSPNKLIHPVNSKLPKSSFLMSLNYVTEKVLQPKSSGLTRKKLAVPGIGPQISRFQGNLYNRSTTTVARQQPF